MIARRIALWLVDLVTILAVGCVSPRESLKTTIIQQVHPGQTRAEVTKILGRPNWSQTSSNGKSGDVYVYDEVVFATRTASESARDLKVRTFSARYDSAGVVEETLLYECLTPAIVLSTTAFAGIAVKPQDLQRIRVGTTTQPELETMFKPPIVKCLHPMGGWELYWFQIDVGASVTHRQDVKGLDIVVDRDGIVRVANFNDTAERR